MKIVVFACNWCYPMVQDLEILNPNTKSLDHSTTLIRVMCSGRITPFLILKAFELGADGVIGVGCPEETCHYGNGNKKAKENFEKACALLHLLGIGRERIGFEQILPDDHGKLEEIIHSFIEAIKV